MSATRRFFTVAAPIALTLLASAVGAALLLRVRNELPDQIAIHWGLRGDADGFATFNDVMTMGWLLPLGSVVPIALAGLALRHGAALAGVAAGTGVFLASMMFGTAYQQRGVTDGEFVRLATWAFLWPMLLGIGVGVVVGLLLRRRRTPAKAGPLPPDAVRADVPATEQATWSGNLRPGRAGQIVLLGAILGTAALGIVMWIFSGIWVVALIAVLLSPLTLLMSGRLEIDERGVRVATMDIGRWTPLSEIVVGRVTEVHCLGDYGGWGPRAGFDGSWGWVTSDGEALRVERSGVGDLVVTVDDAAQAAAVLNTLIERSRG